MTNSSSDEFMRAHEVICGEGCHTSKSTGPLEPLSQGRLVLVDECSKDVLKEPSAVGLARGSDSSLQPEQKELARWLKAAVGVVNRKHQ